MRSGTKFGEIWSPNFERAQKVAASGAQLHTVCRTQSAVHSLRHTKTNWSLFGSDNNGPKMNSAAHAYLLSVPQNGARSSWPPLPFSFFLLLSLFFQFRSLFWPRSSWQGKQTPRVCLLPQFLSIIVPPKRLQSTAKGRPRTANEQEQLLFLLTGRKHTEPSGLLLAFLSAERGSFQLNLGHFFPPEGNLK